MRKVWIFLLLCFTGIAAASQPLKFEDIPNVMERLFTFHIENKQLNTTLVRRSVKLYIEQLDHEKIYLLDEEVRPYLEMSEAKAREILGRLQRRDYSDFFALNGLMQQSIIRAQAARVFLARELIGSEAGLESLKMAIPARYPKSEAEMIERQKTRMLRFYLYHKARTVDLENPERRAKVCKLFEKKAQRIENNYLFLLASGGPMSKERIEYFLTLRILKAFAKSLDTHTSFFSPEEAFEMRMTLEKNFEGIGVVLSEGIDGVVISDLIKGSPAEQSGMIQVNDLLVEVDGISTAGALFEEVLEMLKRKDHGEITLGVQRDQAHFFRVPLLKRPVVMNEERLQTSFERTEAGVIGKITLYSFYENSNGISSERDLKEAIRSFREKGELVGLILDLRENSGGFLSQAVKVAGLFVCNGVIVISKYGQGEVHYLRNIVSKAYYNGPLVVLTSKMSASASEIVAQALQDYGVALVVGDTRTFGKGSIQYQTVTDAKADMFFKVTVGKYYTPSGKSTQLTGVIADIVVPTQYAPFKIGEKYLEYPLAQDQVKPAFEDPLTDLDEKTRKLFEMRYLPYAQRVVSYWRKAIPILRKNSAERLAQDVDFQALQEKSEAISARASALLPNTVDEQIQATKEDIQMKEAVNIVKDMILLGAQEHLPKTGTEP